MKLPEQECIGDSASASSAGPLRNWRSRSRLFFVCTALNLVPLFYFRFIPSNDGPSHVYNSAMLHAFWFSGAGAVSNVFVWNWSLPPNLLTHSVLAVLMSVISPIVAERVLVLGYAALLPIAVRYFLRSVNARTYGLEYLSLAWVYNSHLHWGFYNFLFSLVFFLFGCGYWLRHRQVPSARSMAILAGIATLLYCSHPVGLVEFWIVCCAIAGYELLRENHGWPGAKLLLPALAVTGALYAHYTLTRAHAAGERIDWPTLRYAGSLLFTLSPLASYSRAQRVIAACIPILLLCLAMAVVKRRRLLDSIDAYGVAAVITAALVFIAPGSIGGGTMLTARLVYAPVFLLCGWLIRRDWRVDFGSLTAALGMVLAFAMILSNWHYYSRYDAGMKQLLAAEAHWPGDSSLLFRPAGPATLLLDGSGTPFLSSAAPGYLAAERGQVLIGDYQAAQTYFPLRYRSNLPKELYATTGGNLCPGKDLDTEAKIARSLVPLQAAVFVVPRSADVDTCFSLPPSSQFQVNGVAFLYYRFPDAENSLSLLR